MVVGYGWYHIVGDSLSANSQDTILMLGTMGSIVKIMKDEHEVLDIVAPFIFIELFGFSSSDDLTLGGSLMKSLIANSQFLAS